MPLKQECTTHMGNLIRKMKRRAKRVEKKRKEKVLTFKFD